jgi:hypothetical protein
VSNINSNALNLVSITPKIDINEKFKFFDFIEAGPETRPGLPGPASKPGRAFYITKLDPVENASDQGLGSRNKLKHV